MVDGPGFRTSIYCAGCPNHCPGCHNPQSWDISHGTMTSTDELLEVTPESLRIRKRILDPTMRKRASIAKKNAMK